MPPKRKPKKSSDPRPGGRGANVGGMINSISTAIISQFLLLPPRARQDLLTHLKGICENTNIQSNDRDEKKEGPKDKPAENSQKVKSWDRPLIKELNASQRLKSLSKSERNSDQAKIDGAMVSAALAAAARSKKHQVSEADLRTALLGAQDTLDNMRALYPAESGIPEPAPGTATAAPEDVTPMDTTAETSTPRKTSNQHTAEALSGVEGLRGFPSNVVSRLRRSSTGHSIDGDTELAYFCTTLAIKKSSERRKYFASPSQKSDTSNPTFHKLPPEAKEKYLSHFGPGDTALPEGHFELAIAYLKETPGDYSALAEYIRFRDTDGRIFLYGVPIPWGDMRSPSPKASGQKRPRA